MLGVQSETFAVTLRTLVFIAALAVALPAQSLAQEAPPAVEAEPVVTLEVEIGVVSDYRYRGVSLSKDRPALQASATISHAAGVYGDVTVSTIDEYGIGPDGDGAGLELSLTGGWAGSAGGFDLDLALAAYLYPDGTGVNYVELPLSVSRTWDAWTLSAGLEYAPAQEALGDEDNAYVWLGGDWAPEDSDWAVTAWVGREDGAWAPDGKTDWGLGLRRAVGGRVTLGLTYVDTDVSWADAALVGEVRATF